MRASPSPQGPHSPGATNTWLMSPIGGHEGDATSPSPKTSGYLVSPASPATHPGVTGAFPILGTGSTSQSPPEPLSPSHRLLGHHGSAGVLVTATKTPSR